MPINRTTKQENTPQSLLTARRRVKTVQVSKPKSLVNKSRQAAKSALAPTTRRSIVKPTVKPVVHKKTIGYKPQSRQIPNTKQRMARNPRSFNVNRSRHIQRRPRNLKVDPDAIQALREIGKGKVLIIVGNGPSHKEADLPKLRNFESIDFMSINKPDDRIWPTEHWLFCDNSQLRRHKALWTGYGGTLINSISIKESKNKSVHLITKQGKGFSFNLVDGVYIGRSSVFAAMQVGLWMNYEHVYIFGCDMAAVGGKLYPWGSNPDVSDANRLKRFATEAQFYNWAAENVKDQHRKKFTFCSAYNPHGFIKAFNKMDHRKAIPEILSRHADQK